MMKHKISLILNAKNGNILITATNGKIRLQGTDIELVAVGDGDLKVILKWRQQKISLPIQRN